LEPNSTGDKNKNERGVKEIKTEIKKTGRLYKRV
jgi:hypothetical protein